MSDAIYDRLVAAGCEIDHHESDLYVKATPESLAIICAAEADGQKVARNKFGQVLGFRSAIDGAHWYDVPFGFMPFWRRKSAVQS
jgi:hypothetical protein